MLDLTRYWKDCPPLHLRMPPMGLGVSQPKGSTDYGAFLRDIGALPEIAIEQGLVS